ncbi:extracellular mutant protein 11-domain-containing protein [Podospora fimiseda]|uniref:Extracellular mutant protein 11-domain-containing protein n=1 Tax=Podospora fimiseda TaxID=252190 RepID=A0AAN7H0V1_9PEZI|nr:extracellular mutant protein 11-domain-containing protein [Podospora fimiseda]
MGLSMMPLPTATKKKLGAIGLFTRHSAATTITAKETSEVPVQQVVVSPRQAVFGLPASPAPSSALALSGNNGFHHSKSQSNGHATNHAHHSQLPQLQPPPEIVSNLNSNRQQLETGRQDTPTARSLPLPRVGRYASMSSSLPSAPPQQHFHPMQRTRTSASDSEAREPPRPSHPQNAWEDSTVASMFNDAASDRTHTRQPSHGRSYEPPNAYQRQRQQQQTQSKPHQQQQQQQPDNRPQHPAPLQLNRGEKRQKTRHQQEQQHPNGRDENLPFVIDEGGILKVIPPAAAVPLAAPPFNPISSNISNDGANSEGLYQDEPVPFDTPTKNGNGSRRARLPFRENRGPYSPGGSRSGYSPTRGDDLSMSPERAAEVGESLEQVRLEERRKRDRERQRERDREIERQRGREEKERELQQKRSTVFADLDPSDFDEPSFNDTRAAVLAPTSGVDPDDISSEPAPTLRTPRATRHLPGVLPLQIKELPLGRSNSRRIKEQPNVLPTTTTQTKSLKRRMSLDYNDAELHAMSFSDLKNQAFDYDPQAAALQQTTIVPKNGTVEERMLHYKDKGSIDQHQFFTRMSVDEWDEAGDWFLEQFSNVVQKIKKARKAKRTLMTQFEEEISAREEAVRGKIEGIGKTLEELKQEGQTMMQGKDTDLEF